jgi:hypothetical protein
MPATQSASYSAIGSLREKLALAKAAFEAWLGERERRRQADFLARLQTPWQQYWGEAYGLELKQWMLKPVFEKLEAEGKAGDLIVDIGSGARPVTRFFQSRPGRKRILVDVAADNGVCADERRIRLDAEKVAEPGALRALSVQSVAIRTDCEAGFVKGDPALDWGFRGKAPVIHPSGKPALQNRIHLAAFEPISHSAAISRLALIERAPRFSITISRQINQKNQRSRHSRGRRTSDNPRESAGK